MRRNTISAATFGRAKEATSAHGIQFSTFESWRLGALAVHPADDSVNAHLAGKPYVHDIFAPGAIAGGSPTLLGIAATVYAVGRLKD